MIKGRQQGDNITIMNTMFKRGTDPRDNKFKEILTLVYKDCDTGLKYKEEIENPDYEYYIANEDNRVNYNRLFIEKENTEKISVPYKDLEKDIAERVGLKDFYYQNVTNGNRSENRKLHLHPNIFNSDMNIEDHYRFRFGKLYKNETCPITKSFFDIEVDSISMSGDFPQPGECPINAISLVCQDRKEIYVFLLRNKINPLIDEFENQVKDGSIFEELQNFIVGWIGEELASKYNLNFKFNFLFYDEEDEIKLIGDLFNAFNNFKPDFALAWNMSFDIPYIIERIRRLGYAPEEIMCHPDFNHKTAYYFVDERMKSEFSERGDFALISSYTTFLDQMIHFASRRKGQGKFISFTLDAIGEAIAKVRKLDYKHITTNLAELPYKDYKSFVFYNIMDTIVQYCIEFMTGDLEYLFGKCNINNTRYAKAHRQTVYLTNRGTKEFFNEGLIIGNNANKYNQKPSEKFPGAFVAEPRQVNNYARLKIYGRLIDVFDNCDDFDYASLYPSIIRQYNVAPNTQIGMLKIMEQVHNRENPCKLEHWTRAGSFMEDIQSQVWLEVCTRWFALADYTQMYHEVEWFFENVMNPFYGLKYYNRDGLIIPMTFDNTNLQLQEAIDFADYRWSVKEQFIAPDLERWEAWRNAALANPNQHF